MLLQVKQDFWLPPSTYLLSHSVGRPLKSTEQAFHQAYFAPWQDSGREPWGAWLPIIDRFTDALAALFGGNADDFCPQVNLSSALTKLVMALPRLTRPNAVVLMSEIDFPSMGFALQQALPPSCRLKFVPATQDITDLNVWAEHLSADVDLVFVSHAYSNSGQQAPINELLPLIRERGALSCLDVAQSAGILPLHLATLAPDFMLGSSVKWLSSGPGAAYLWIAPEHIASCQPKDVGWFSHENPFEFNIHDYRNHPSARRFWGGTPSIAPYAIAAHSIDYMAHLGSAALRQHNLALQQQLIDGLKSLDMAHVLASPERAEQRSGTLILQFGEQQAAVLAALQHAEISVDVRHTGIRVSPHIYNDAADIEGLLQVVKQVVK